MVMIYSLVFPMHALGMPQGGQVVAGQAEISMANPQTMNIQQGTPKAIMNWQQFSIARPEAVHFMQPSAAATALNRVVGVDPSEIHGLLSANGRVFLINPNGLLVGPTGRIETAGFVASTLDMANQDFLNGNYVFIQDPGKPLSAILNQGLIRADQGNVSLIAPGVENQGEILASLGTVSLGAGEQVTLAFAGNEMIRFVIDAPVTGKVIGPDGEPMEDTLLNSGTISADGGEVILSARSAFDAVKSVVNNTGVIEATTIEEQNGIIRLDGGDQGIVYNSGTLDVSGMDEGETGGEVRITGEKVGLVHYSKILARGRRGGGKVLIGGDYQGKNPDVQNAGRTYVGADSIINADAVDSGDGGKIIVWSDEVTRFYGNISARGGAEGGDGGFAEVSGKQQLVFTGDVDLYASNGDSGILLLDPVNITVQAGPGGTLNGELTPDPPGPLDDSILFGEGGVNTTLDVAELTAFTSGTIVLQSGDTVGDKSEGNITFAASGTLQSGVSLVAQAEADITINDGITLAATGAGTIHLEADTPHDGGGTGGNIVISGTGRISSESGDITLIGDDFAISGTGSITSSGGGNVIIARSDSLALTLGTTGQLQNSEANRISTTGALRIGEATTAGTDGKGAGASTLTSASITIADEAFAPSSVGELKLTSAGDITDTTGSISVSELALVTSSTNSTAVSLDAANNVTNLAANLTGEGGVFSFTNEADGFTVSSVDGVDGITTAGSSTSGTATGGITLSVTTGTITITNNVTTGPASVVDAAGDQSAVSGNINLTATTGISGAGQLVTGSAELTGADAGAAANDTVTSGTIILNLTGAGDVGLSGTNALQIGTATGNDPSSLIATTGDISIGNTNAPNRVNDGAVDSALEIVFGGATGGSTNTPGTLSVTTPVPVR